MLVGVILFVYVAYGYRRVEPVIRPDVVEPLELAGALAIIAIELFGLFLKRSLSASFLPLGTIRSGGILQSLLGQRIHRGRNRPDPGIFGRLGMGHNWSRDDEEGARDDEPHCPLFPNQ